MSKYDLFGLDAADAAFNFLNEQVIAHPDYQPQRSVSQHVKVAGFDTLYLRAFPTALPRRLVVSSISLPTRHCGKGVFNVFHHRLMEYAAMGDGFIVEYENVTSARLLHYLARKPLTFLGGHLREYERDMFTLDKVAAYSAQEKADPEWSAMPVSATVMCAPNFLLWLKFAVQRAANVHRVPLNPLYNDVVTSAIPAQFRWPGDYDCVVVSVTGYEKQALSLVVRGVPDGLDLGEVNLALGACGFTYTDHSMQLSELFVTLHEATTNRSHQINLNLTKQ